MHECMNDDISMEGGQLNIAQHSSVLLAILAVVSVFRILSHDVWLHGDSGFCTETCNCTKFVKRTLVGFDGYWCRVLKSH